VLFFGQVTGKALILDEIINYVQSLQNQVEVKKEKKSRSHEELILSAKNVALLADNNLQIIYSCLFFQFLSMRIASMSPVLYGFGLDSDGLHDHAQVWNSKIIFLSAKNTVNKLMFKCEL
jgi:BHLH transcription factor Upa20